MLQFYSRAMSFAPLNLPLITTLNLPQGTVSLPYSFQLTETGGFSPYTWAIVSGSLPSGLVLNAGGLISGTPITQQTLTLALQVTDSHGRKSQVESFNLVVLAPINLTFAGETLPSAATGVPYSQNISGQAIGGTLPYTFTLVSTTGPDTISVSAAGVITFTPTAQTLLTNAAGVFYTNAAGTYLVAT